MEDKINKDNGVQKNRRTIRVLGVLLLVGITYNVYKAFFWKPEESLNSQVELIEGFNSMTDEHKKVLLDRYKNLDSNYQNMVLEEDTAFRNFLDSADAILDSMGCNCPDVQKRLKENSK